MAKKKAKKTSSKFDDVIENQTIVSDSCTEMLRQMSLVQVNARDMRATISRFEGIWAALDRRCDAIEETIGDIGVELGRLQKIIKCVHKWKILDVTYAKGTRQISAKQKTYREGRVSFICEVCGEKANKGISELTATQKRLVKAEMNEWLKLSD